MEDCKQRSRKEVLWKNEKRIEKSHRQRPEVVSWQYMWRDNGITNSRTLLYNVHEHQGTRGVRKHWNSKHYLLTHLLTPWCRVLLDKLTGLQLVKKFPAFHGNRRFITALTSVRKLSLSWASPIQSICPHPTSWRSVLILSTHLRLGLPSCLFPSGFPTKTLNSPSPHPYAPHAQPISFQHCYLKLQIAGSIR
jgi:hypothetical protein